jgi:hypothetical protein
MSLSEKPICFPDPNVFDLTESDTHRMSVPKTQLIFIQVKLTRWASKGRPT